MWVKICANTRVEDAVLAAELGADTVGFVFAPSRRQVTAAQAAAIVRELPPGVERVGVFASASADEVERAVAEAGLTTVQMHDGYDEALAVELARRLPQAAVLWTVPWQVDRPAQEVEGEVSQRLTLLAAATPGARALLDAKVGAASGGLGISFDWVAAGRAIGSADGVNVILAGGLNPQNVSAAIAASRPWGVDVASGVESAPGVKDAGKLRDFLAAAKPRCPQV